MHESYEIRLKHRCDFKIKYRFYSQSEGGRLNLPHQGIRLDFWYESDNHTMKGNFMIWPEFENLEGDLILDGEVLESGIARMWIINDKLRSYHQKRINIGAKGYLYEGLKIAECEIIEIIDLMENPISNE